MESTVWGGSRHLPGSGGVPVAAAARVSCVDRGVPGHEGPLAAAGGEAATHHANNTVPCRVALAIAPHAEQVAEKADIGGHPQACLVHSNPPQYDSMASVYFDLYYLSA